METGFISGMSDARTHHHSLAAIFFRRLANAQRRHLRRLFRADPSTRFCLQASRTNVHDGRNPLSRHRPCRGKPHIHCCLFGSYAGPDSCPYSYEGHIVTHQGKAFRLGPKIVFIASEPTVEEWRKLIRVLYAHETRRSGAMHVSRIC